MMKKLEDLYDQKQCRAEKPEPFKEVVDLMKRVRRESEEDASKRVDHVSDTIIKLAEKMRFAGESSDGGGDESPFACRCRPARVRKRTGYGRENG
jgi:hypothetical protein